MDEHEVPGPVGTILILGGGAASENINIIYTYKTIFSNNWGAYTR